jgi:hypothetical protein
MVQGGRTGWAVSISGDESTVAVGAPKGGTKVVGLFLLINLMDTILVLVRILLV